MVSICGMSQGKKPIYDKSSWVCLDAKLHFGKINNALHIRKNTNSMNFLKDLCFGVSITLQYYFLLWMPNANGC